MVSSSGDSLDQTRRPNRCARVANFSPLPPRATDTCLLYVPLHTCPPPLGAAGCSPQAAAAHWLPTHSMTGYPVAARPTVCTVLARWTGVPSEAHRGRIQCSATAWRPGRPARRCACCADSTAGYPCSAFAGEVRASALRRWAGVRAVLWGEPLPPPPLPSHAVDSNTTMATTLEELMQRMPRGARFSDPFMVRGGWGAGRGPTARGSVARLQVVGARPVSALSLPPPPPPHLPPCATPPLGIRTLLCGAGLASV
jgi:hypothetical protein